MKIFRVVIAIWMAILVIGIAVWAREFLRVDQCYDSGGAIAADGTCVGGHPWGTD